MSTAEKIEHLVIMRAALVRRLEILRAGEKIKEFAYQTPQEFAAERRAEGKQSSEEADEPLEDQDSIRPRRERKLWPREHDQLSKLRNQGAYRRPYNENRIVQSQDSASSKRQIQDEEIEFEQADLEIDVNGLAEWPANFLLPDGTNRLRETLMTSIIISDRIEDTHIEVVPGHEIEFPIEAPIYQPAPNKEDSKINQQTIEDTQIADQD